MDVSIKFFFTGPDDDADDDEGSDGGEGNAG